jgi:hypothetical protein
MEISKDFDFIIGQWQVKNRKLKERLCQCDEWIEFDGTFESRFILNGLGNMDEMKVKNDDMDFCGLSIRIYNPLSREWTIYWADNHHPEQGVKPQVTGRFKNKVGTFYGEEMYNNKLISMRFIWESISADHASWSQAYLDGTNESWEINWTMDFYRI